VNTLIDIHSVSKCYHIYEHPKDRFKQALLDKWRQLGRYKEKADYYREFWALRDISFQLEAGESVGILGRNGAGKSTLLQIVVGTITPTSGNVITHGRITALLELGSGFNPEFSGRENVLLNAQILGLTEAQALDKYDEIASFADIGDFINQPVKTYSSGMMVRLAFAVQTAVDPKILIIDEALAVGDMFFQAKCMARIRKLVDSGVALLFVSHATDIVRQLCSRAVLLQNGRLVAFGNAKKVADQYSSVQLEERNLAAKVTLEGRQRMDRTLNGSNSIDEGSVPDQQGIDSNPRSIGTDSAGQSQWSEGVDLFLVRASHHRIGNGDAEILNFQMFSQGQLAGKFDFDENANIRVYVRFHVDLSNVTLSLQVRNRQGTGLVFFDLRLQQEMHRRYNAGQVYLFDWNMKLPLMTESYSVQCVLAHPPVIPGDDWVFIDSIPDAYEFTVSPIPDLPVSSFVVLPAQVNINAVS